MAKKTKRKTVRGAAKKSVRGGKKKRGAKKKTRAVKASAAKKSRETPRYLVINTHDGLSIRAAATLTPELRADARDGIISIIDCHRVLAMTDKGAWSVLGDQYKFASKPPRPVVEAVAPEAVAPSVEVAAPSEPEPAAAQPVTPPAAVPSAAPEVDEDEDTSDSDEPEDDVPDAAELPRAAHPAEAHA